MLVALSTVGVSDAPKEIDTVKAMLDSGLSLMHLRKPSASMAFMQGWLRELPREYTRKIVWHLPYSLLGAEFTLPWTIQATTATLPTMKKVIENIERFALNCGIHRIHVPAWFRDKAALMDINWHELLSHEWRYSSSIHHMQELDSVAAGFRKQGLTLDYVTVSPVFDSLSKIGYKANNALLTDVLAYKSGLRSGFPVRLLALGGVHGGRMTTLKEYGFDGAVLNGCLWHPDNDGKMTLHQFKSCYKQWKD